MPAAFFLAVFSVFLAVLSPTFSSKPPVSVNKHVRWVQLPQYLQRANTFNITGLGQAVADSFGIAGPLCEVVKEYVLSFFFDFVTQHRLGRPSIGRDPVIILLSNQACVYVEAIDMGLVAVLNVHQFLSSIGDFRKSLRLGVVEDSETRLDDLLKLADAVHDYAKASSQKFDVAREFRSKVHPPSVMKGNYI